MIVTTPALDGAIAALREAEEKIGGEGLRPPRQLAGRRNGESRAGSRDGRQGGKRRRRSGEEEAADTGRAK